MFWDPGSLGTSALSQLLLNPVSAAGKQGEAFAPAPGLETKTNRRYKGRALRGARPQPASERRLEGEPLMARQGGSQEQFPVGGWLPPCVAWLAGVMAESITGRPDHSIGHKFMALEGCTPALPGARVVGGG